MTTQNNTSDKDTTECSPGQVTFLGTADAFNTGGRANSCYWVDDALGSYVIDFGPTALMRSQQYEKNLYELDAILVTHLHGDHIGGLPMLFLHLNYDLKRTKPLVIAGPPSTAAFIETLWYSTYPSTVERELTFEIQFVSWVHGQWIEVCNRKVLSEPAIHDAAAEPHSLRIEGPDYAIAVSGDTGWHMALMTLSDNADLFICEATNSEAGYWGHLSVEEHAEHRDLLTPKSLVLSHLSMSALNAAEAQAVKNRWIVASDGLVIGL